MGIVVCLGRRQCPTIERHGARHFAEPQHGRMRDWIVFAAFAFVYQLIVLD